MAAWSDPPSSFPCLCHCVTLGACLGWPSLYELPPTLGLTHTELATTLVSWNNRHHGTIAFILQLAGIFFSSLWFSPPSLFCLPKFLLCLSSHFLHPLFLPRFLFLLTFLPAYSSLHISPLFLILLSPLFHFTFFIQILHIGIIHPVHTCVTSHTHWLTRGIVCVGCFCPTALPQLPGVALMAGLELYGHITII